LTLVSAATVAGLLLGMLGGGLGEVGAGLALAVGVVAAIGAWAHTAPLPPGAGDAGPATSRTSSPGQARFWAWAVGVLFTVFAVRSFCWLLYVDGNHLKIQSPNNLGDLALHLTYITYFANGVPLWPDNPIHVFSALRYPAGLDLFDALFVLLHVDVLRALVWTGLLGSLATFYALYRWGGAFAVAGFLCNGGLAGYQFFEHFQFADYQAGVGWKSIPLAMFVTQRGLQYAIPAGLLLLLHWRRKYWLPEGAAPPVARRGLIPWWVELLLYATMPLFHLHTFLALSALLACWLLIGEWDVRTQVGRLLAAALVPATWIVWTITGRFQSASILAWAPGWVASDPAFAVPSMNVWFVTLPPAFGFWIYDFGLTLPAFIALVGVIGWQSWRNRPSGRHVFSSAGAFVLPAVAIFLLALFVRTAPWGWDNIKLIVWSYVICLPFLWRDVIAKWPVAVRVGICVVLFASGCVSLIGGLRAGSPGFDIADRTEVNAVAAAVRTVPIEARFAAFPTYNHPLLLNGRKLVLGYPGHLWTQGLDYGAVEQQLTALMLGESDWRERARALRARYLYWGDEERRAYASSSEPWRGNVAVVATGVWGTIYDLETSLVPNQP
jgi:hypothetical protein